MAKSLNRPRNYPNQQSFVGQKTNNSPPKLGNQLYGKTETDEVRKPPSWDHSHKIDHRRIEDDDEMIEIHVNDENKNIQRDFKCPWRLLFQEMKYFEAHAKDSYQDDLDISVHCDVAIFEWLMWYIKNKSDPQLSKFITSSCKKCNFDIDFLQLFENGMIRGRLCQVCCRTFTRHC